MNYLFVDNFRGFEKTYFPIMDVNFFVGENSTGKTSILGLIKLLSSTKFWLTRDFDSDEVNFGHFKDIVSINSQDRSYFSVGMVIFEEKDGIQGFLMTFVEREGMPRISKYSYYYRGKEFIIKFGKKITKYKHKDIEQPKDVYEFIDKVFNSWVNAHKNDNKGYTKFPESMPIPYRELLLFLHDVLLDVVSEKSEGIRFSGSRLPSFAADVIWLAPIRTKPQRTYDEYRIEFSPEGEHTPYLIRKILDNKKESKIFLKFVEEFGRSSGLFESVSIKNYGRSVTSPFELDVIINEKPLCINNVGYGVSQSLPLIVELFTQPERTWFAIQQPEVHLHPRAQAALGDVVFELSVKERKKFIIETHTDFMIDRFRLNYRKKLPKKPKAQVLFFERVPEGNRVHSLELTGNGELPYEQPKTYRDFFIREEMKIIGV